jgi:hypothetical protein
LPEIVQANHSVDTLAACADGEEGHCEHQCHSGDYNQTFNEAEGEAANSSRWNALHDCGLTKAAKISSNLRQKAWMNEYNLFTLLVAQGIKHACFPKLRACAKWRT